jgi:WD40 repeat protein
VAFAPDGRTLASGGDDASIRIWSLAARQRRSCLDRPAGSVWSVAFASDGGSLASGGDDGSTRIWDLVTGPSLEMALAGHTGATLSVAYAPDGRTLASGGANGSIHIWDLTAQGGLGDAASLSQASTQTDPDQLRGSVGQVLTVPAHPPLYISTGHASSVMSVAWSLDGRILASGGSDGRVLLWDPVTGQHVGQPLTGDGGAGLAWRSHRMDELLARVVATAESTSGIP